MSTKFEVTCPKCGWIITATGADQSSFGCFSCGFEFDAQSSTVEEENHPSEENEIQGSQSPREASALEVAGLQDVVGKPERNPNLAFWFFTVVGTVIVGLIVFTFLFILPAQKDLVKRKMQKQSLELVLKDLRFICLQTEKGINLESLSKLTVDAFFQYRETTSVEVKINFPATCENLQKAFSSWEAAEVLWRIDRDNEEKSSSQEKLIRLLLNIFGNENFEQAFGGEKFYWIINSNEKRDSLIRALFSVSSDFVNKAENELDEEFSSGPKQSEIEVLVNEAFR